MPPVLPKGRYREPMGIAFQEKSKNEKARLSTNRAGWTRSRVIFRRDGWRCQICGKGLSPDLQGKFAGKRNFSDPDAPTIDHIIPTAHGGSNRAENKQTACYACNHAKNDKA